MQNVATSMNYTVALSRILHKQITNVFEFYVRKKMRIVCCSLIRYYLKHFITRSHTIRDLDSDKIAGNCLLNRHIINLH